jgi:ABC-type phosphate transport system substrate-binding protein
MPRRLNPISARRSLLAALVLAGCVIATVMAVPSQADFTTGKCLGSNVTGRGASFQTGAQAGWKTDFQDNYCSDVGIFPTITYEPQGSGAGRRAMGERTGTNATGSQSRNQVPRFGATDEAPNPTQVGQMNMGTDTAGDEGTVHVIPAAVGSVVLAVNFPDNCDRSLLPDSAETNPASANSAPFIDRVRFTRTQFEAVWNGDAAADQWTEVFPTLGSDPDCADFITRVVRFDDSGTTFTIKDYLNELNPARGWKTTYITGPDTRNWPNATVAARPDCAGTPQGPQGAHLTSGCANGNGPLVQKLATVDGGIGYSDIATARTNGYDIAPGGTRDDDLFWTQAPNPSNTFTEPTADPNGFRTDGLRGANCATAQFTSVPASTLGDWFPTSGVDSTTGAYVICTLTYVMAWDDYKPPYSLEGCGTACEEQKARSVKDYLSSIISDSGQETLFPNDYGPLPEDILTIARNGVNAICWDKAGTGSCPVTRYGFPRPRGATPLRVSLVPGYNSCAAPNRTHGAPLAFPSCNPPTQSSGTLTVGTPDANGVGANSTGSVLYRVLAGNPATPADEADVQVTLSITDVRNKAGLSDYTGQVQLNSSVQITDRVNGTTGAQPGTVEAINFPVTVNCTATALTNIGSTCAATTTFDAVVPGAIPDQKRSLWEFGQVFVNDGGPDGLVSTGPNTVFERQGVFIP